MSPVEALVRAAGMGGQAALDAQAGRPVHVRKSAQDRPVCGTHATGLAPEHVTGPILLCGSCVRVLTATHPHPGVTSAADERCRRWLTLRDWHQLIAGATQVVHLAGADRSLSAISPRRNGPLPVITYGGDRVDDLWLLLRQTRDRLHTPRVPQLPSWAKGQGRDHAYYDHLNAAMDRGEVPATRTPTTYDPAPRGSR